MTSLTFLSSSKSYAAGKVVCVEGEGERMGVWMKKGGGGGEDPRDDATCLSLPNQVIHPTQLTSNSGGRRSSADKPLAVTLTVE